MPRAEKRRAARGLPRAVAAALALAGACSVHGGSRVAYEAPPRLDERAREILERSRTEGRAGKLLADLLAVAPKRLAGSPGADRAVAWAEQAMRDAGLDRVWREVVTVPRWVRGDLEEVEVVSEPPQRLRATALGGSIATPAAGIEADVVEVRSDDELRALGDRARGRIVFFNRPMDSADRDTFRAYGGAVDQRSHGPVDASKAGGVAALVRSATTRIDDSPHTGSTRYDSEVPRIPAAALSTVAADRLHALL
ncbi:MAG TPA: peptidase M28 family protein, partial [Planctomycetota bacterium]|nr:peptidase M28 family protein [Planctomycetota bacterium]